MSNHFKKRRDYLMKLHPYCTWCGCKLIYFSLKPHQKMPDNFATLDHFYSRISGKRYDPHFKQITMVLSCHKCNDERARIEDKNLPIFEKWKRSRKYPKWIQFIINLFKL